MSSSPDASSESPSAGADRRFTFPRSHRLKRTRLLRSLFDRSRDDVQTVAVGCIRLLFRVVDRAETGYDVPLQIGFAPGRNVRTGVDRTRVRRLLREGYRLNQHLLTDRFRDRDDALIVMALFRGRSRAEAEACIEHDLPRALQRCADRFES